MNRAGMMIRFRRIGLLFIPALAVTACSGSLAPGVTGVPSVRAKSLPVDRVANYKSLFSFGGTDGSSPAAQLVDLGGILYGTTPSGGKQKRGVVYSITTSGKETVLYSFGGAPDGTSPANIVAVDGMLYGITVGGGRQNGGTIFRLSSSGKEQVLYSFGAGSDGYRPTSLIYANGTLYGTTGYGGANGAGVVFGATTAGKEEIIYSFAGGKDDGSYPNSLVYLNGKLYGTTSLGGNQCPLFTSETGCGTAFGISLSGKEVMLYRFKGPPDGEEPVGLTAVGNSLYGDTMWGGRSECFLAGTFNAGCGDVFTVTASGKERVIYSFESGKAPSGFWPDASLIHVDGILYGTTLLGGGGSCYMPSQPGCGTIFGVTTKGQETQLYGFGGKPDGAYPEGALRDVAGVLFGTASYGGEENDGTAFSVAP